MVAGAGTLGLDFLGEDFFEDMTVRGEKDEMMTMMMKRRVMMVVRMM